MDTCTSHLMVSPNFLVVVQHLSQQQFLLACYPGDFSEGSALVLIKTIFPFFTHVLSVYNISLDQILTLTHETDKMHLEILYTCKEYDLAGTIQGCIYLLPASGSKCWALKGMGCQCRVGFIRLSARAAWEIFSGLQTTVFPVANCSTPSLLHRSRVRQCICQWVWSWLNTTLFRETGLRWDVS